MYCEVSNVWKVVGKVLCCRLLKDDPLLCRSVEIEKNKIKAILENNQYRGQFFAEKYKFKEDLKDSKYAVQKSSCQK